jgi:mRNA interferase RelE/StbE
MQVIVTRQFAKDVHKELDKAYQIQLADIIDQIRNAQTLHEIQNVKKLKGYKTAYRIKIDDFRIGFLLEANQVVLSRVLNRKEIYRYFP